MLKPVRAVFASQFGGVSAARWVLPGIRDSGWLVDEVETASFSMPPVSLVVRAENRLRKKGQLARLQRSILRAVQDTAAEVFFTMKGTLIAADTLRSLRSGGTYCVNYYPDYHFNDVPISAMADYDLVITTKSFQLDALTRLLGADRVGFVHHGYCDEVHRPIPHSEQPVDILYIGNPTPAKVALMSSIVSAMPDLRFRVCGARWRGLVKATPLDSIDIGDAPHGDYYADEIGAAKIVLAFHMGVDPATGFEDLVSARTFEIPACGGFMLHVDNTEVRTLFEPGMEMDVFDGLDELVAKVRYWLANPEERAAVAARGHARAVPAYGYAERGREIAAIVTARRSSARARSLGPA